MVETDADTCSEEPFNYTYDTKLQWLEKKKTKTNQTLGASEQCEHTLFKRWGLFAATCRSVSMFSPSFIGQMNLIVFKGLFTLDHKGRKSASDPDVCCVFCQMRPSRCLGHEMSDALKKK